MKLSKKEELLRAEALKKVKEDLKRNPPKKIPQDLKDGGECRKNPFVKSLLDLEGLV